MCIILCRWLDTRYRSPAAVTDFAKRQKSDARFAVFVAKRGAICYNTYIIKKGALLFENKKQNNGDCGITGRFACFFASLPKGF